MGETKDFVYAVKDTSALMLHHRSPGGLVEVMARRLNFDLAPRQDLG